MRSLTSLHPPAALALLLIVVCAGGACAGGACAGDDRSDTPPAPPTSPPAPSPAPPEPEPELEMLPIEDDEEAALAALGAIPAWESVVARAHYLGRREQSGVIHGRLGGVVDGYRWLVDETEGAGALAVRLAVDDRIDMAEGQRLVVWGAWRVDEAGRWYWDAERVAGLAPRAGDGDAGAASTPGLEIAVIPAPPAGAEPVSQRETPGDILFEVCAEPTHPTDGWEIADRTADPPVARLLLPGEHPSYGAQDYRSPDEHWRLEPHVPYVVQVKRFRPPRDDEPILMRAVAAPRRIAPAGDRSATR